MWFLFSSALAASLTFAEATSAALHGTPAITRLEAVRDAGVATSKADGIWLDNPSLSAETRGSELEARFQLPLPLAGQPFANHQISQSGQAVAAAHWDADRATYIAEVGRAYLDLQRLTDLDDLAHDSFALAIRMRDAAKARREAGEMGAVDATIASAVAATDGLRASRVHQDTVEASLHLEVLLGRDPTGDVSPAGWPDLAPPAITLDPTQFPTVAAAAALEQRRRSEATRAAMDLFRPQATLGVDNTNTLSPIIGVSLPIPLSGSAHLRAAKASAAASTAAAQETTLTTSALWRGALLERASAEQAWTETAVDGLDTALDALARAFDGGELSLSEYVTRRDAVVAGLATRIDARWRLENAALTLWELSGNVPGETP